MFRSDLPLVCTMLHLMTETPAIPVPQAEPPAREFQHSAVQALSAIAQHHGLPLFPDRLVHEYALEAAEPDTKTLIRMARDIGLKARSQLVQWEQLLDLNGVFPLLLRLRDGTTLVVAGIENTDPAGARLAILDPREKGAPLRMVSRAELLPDWTGCVVFLKRFPFRLGVTEKFGLRWFLPEIWRQRATFRDVALAGLSLNALALASPIFFQLVIDKVFVHESYSTLYVLSVGMLLAVAFEGLFSVLRQYLMLGATNKIDMILTRKTFSHLLALPLGFFESVTAGVIVRHMQQLEKIRGFMTGRLFFTALDSTSLLIFIPMLCFYSFKLALIVMAFAMVISSVVLLVLKPYQARLTALYAAEGQRQSMLVETIHGMRTVKTLALEPKQRKVWDARTARAITMHYRVGQISITSLGIVQLCEKLMPLTIIVVGAAAVFDHSLTVGTLIAFQMLSGRVIGPLVQIVSLAHDYQETALSVRMLGEVMNHPVEREGGGGLRPAMRGRIDVDGLTFRYPGSTIPSLNNINFSIEPGQVIGLVGRSGSGKTTLTRLLLGMYAAQQGIIRFDGVDAREIDLSHLRRSIGVVLQDNFMFRGTVRENIAITRSDAGFEEIVRAAQAAGADEFIERMPQGYDSLLEENASNLSGGQRQRLAIARALLPLPRLLLLDEAASALDPESEAIFLRNLSKIAEGKTVIIVSHRLSTLVNSDQIFVFDRGEVTARGRHGELLQSSTMYKTLWDQQSRHLI